MTELPEWVHDVSGPGIRAISATPAPVTPSRSRVTPAAGRTPAPNSPWKAQLAEEFKKLNTASPITSPSRPLPQMRNRKPFTPSTAEGRKKRQAELMAAMASSAKKVEERDEGDEQEPKRPGSPSPSWRDNDQEVELPPIQGFGNSQASSSISPAQKRPAASSVASSSQQASSGGQSKPASQPRDHPGDSRQFIPHLEHVLGALGETKLQQLPAHLRRSDEKELGLKRKLEDLDARYEAAKQEIQILANSPKKRRTDGDPPSKRLQVNRIMQFSGH